MRAREADQPPRNALQEEDDIGGDQEGGRAPAGGKVDRGDRGSGDGGH